MLLNLFLIIFLIALLSIIRIDNKVIRYFFYVSIGLLLIIFTGFRDPYYFRDYGEYVFIYKAKYFLIEPTFIFIGFLVRFLLGNQVLFLFIIYAIIAIGIKLYAINQLTTLLFPSLLIFVCDLYMLQENTQIRAAVATGFLLLCVKPLFDRNLKQFLFFAFIAVLFHLSSFLIFFLWFITPTKLNKIKYSLFLLGAYLIAILGIDVVQLIGLIPISAIHQKFLAYSSYKKEVAEANIFSLFFLLKTVLYFFFLWKAELLAEYNKYSYVLIKIMGVSLISLLLFSKNITAGLRINEFFSIVNIVLFPLLIYLVRPYIIARLIILILGILILYIRVFYSPLLLHY